MTDTERSDVSHVLDDIRRLAASVSAFHPVLTHAVLLQDLRKIRGDLERVSAFLENGDYEGDYDN